MRPSAAQGQTELSEKQATEIGTEVYLYGYPLVTMEMTRRMTTNTAAPAGLRSPMGQFAHFRQFPPATYRDIPGANADTLYSVAWLDLSQVPMFYTFRTKNNRFYMMSILDGWTEVIGNPGTRPPAITPVASN